MFIQFLQPFAGNVNQILDQLLAFGVPWNKAAALAALVGLAFAILRGR